MTRDELIARIKETAYLEGDFTLRSGKKSKYYLDKYLFETCPDILKALGEEFAKYVTDDVTLIAGAELGGALKNVMAIACGAVIGARLGDSARAALMTRGYAEMQRMALKLGARPETLAGLSGFGDLILTCTSEGSRNSEASASKTSSRSNVMRRSGR